MKLKKAYKKALSATGLGLLMASGAVAGGYALSTLFLNVGTIVSMEYNCSGLKNEMDCKNKIYEAFLGKQAKAEPKVPAI